MTAPRTPLRSTCDSELAAAGVRDLDLRAGRSAVTAMRGAAAQDHIVAAWNGHDESVMRRHHSVAHEERMAAAGEALAEALGGL